jgi:uncharacterized protein with GYD domain
MVDPRRVGHCGGPLPGADLACSVKPTAPEGTFMATYIVLGNFTDQGIKTVRETTHRAEAVEAAARKAGLTMKQTYWTLGSHDIVAIFEAPDDTAMTAFGLSIGAAGNIRTQTLRGFDRGEMNAILAKVK